MFVQIYDDDDVFLDVIETTEELMDSDLKSWEKENQMEIGSVIVSKEVINPWEQA